MPRKSATRVFLVLALICLAATTANAQPAGECVIGPGMGSTLFFPYFEVDLNDANGVTSLISINNGELDATLTRVVLWTDWGVPTLAFDVFLVGLDIQTINLRSVFNGNVPSTGAGADLSSFDFCDSLPPDHANPVLTVDERGQLAADHQGMTGPLDGTFCAGQAYGDGIARGYITVDVVDECSGVEGFNPFFTPANESWPYFADGGDPSGIGIIDNRLWGDIVYVDFNNNSAQGSEAVSLWADAAVFSGGPEFTFYGRFSSFDSRDDRVPLPRLWDQRFLNGGPFAGGADLLIYRDSAVGVEFATCGMQPSWFPLDSTAFALSEEGDDFVDLGTGASPLITQRVPVSSFGIPYDFGLIEYSSMGQQSWVQPTLAAGGLFSAAFNGTPILFTCGTDPLPME